MISFSQHSRIENKKAQLFWKTYVEVIDIMTKSITYHSATIIAEMDVDIACIVLGSS